LIQVIGISQRVITRKDFSERYDALDQRWLEFLHSCSMTALPLSNHLLTVKNILANFALAGILLTGGNDLGCYQGDALERDEVEFFLLEYAINNNLPLIGVCRGMQVIQDYFGIKLQKVKGHIIKEQKISINEVPGKVNSFHCWGTDQTNESLDVWARADDGIIKAVKHRSKNILGIMWHPERFDPFRSEDIIMFNNYFNQLK
jgi:N5-(cytidine 5'-diphosphoramidyl)-L-glutamine hydrolase